MLPRDMGQIAGFIEDLAGPIAALGRGAIEAFRDEAGHRRGVDRALLLHLAGERMNAAEHEAAAEAEGDEAFWWALLDESVATRVRAGARGGHGALIGTPVESSIEAWTQAQLSAVHAFSSLGGPGSWEWERTIDAARWLMREIQPDNATNQAWATHVFAWIWVVEGDPEACLYAETILNNCVVSLGRPDRFSACLLHHSARWLRAHHRSRGAGAPG